MAAGRRRQEATCKSLGRYRGRAQAANRRLASLPASMLFPVTRELISSAGKGVLRPIVARHGSLCWLQEADGICCKDRM